MPVMRALGSISRNVPIVVPVLLCPHAGTAASSVNSAADRIRFLMRTPLSSFDDRNLTDEIAKAGRIDAIDVEPGCHVQIVLGAPVPCHESVVRPVLAQRLHQLSPH